MTVDGLPPIVRLPRSVEELERIWRALPCAGLWFLMGEGLWPTLEEEIKAREAAWLQARS